MTLSMILTHLALVVAALVFAILAGVPLGILCYFYPSARRVVLRVVDLIQTTPALALLGIIMVFMGAGKPTVIVGLALYSLLPIVRNTHLGLSQVPEYLIEAGPGHGHDPDVPPAPCGAPPGRPHHLHRASASPRSTPSAPRSLPPSWGAADWAASSPPASARTIWRPSCWAPAC